MSGDVWLDSGAESVQFPLLNWSYAVNSVMSDATYTWYLEPADP